MTTRPRVKEAVKPAQTEQSLRSLSLTIGPGETATVRRFADSVVSSAENLLTGDFERIFSERQQEADECDATVSWTLVADAKQVMAAKVWRTVMPKQFYHYCERMAGR